jgi:hypothetical protein
MPYCENCGKEVNANAKFCRSCGAPQNVAETKATSAAVSEHVVSKPVVTQPVVPAISAPESARVRPAYVAPGVVPPPPAKPSYVAPIGNVVNVSVPSQSPRVNVQVKTEPVLGVLVLRKPKSLGRFDSYSGVLTNQRFIFALMTGEMLKDAAMKARVDAKADGKGFFGQWSDQLKASFAFSRRYFSMEPANILSETPGNFAVDNNTVVEVKLKLKNIGNEEMDRHEFEIEVKSSSGKYEFRMDENGDYVKLLKQVYGERVKTPFGYFSSHGVKIKLG